MVTLMFVQIVS